MHEQDYRWSRETAQQAAQTTGAEHPTEPQPGTGSPPVVPSQPVTAPPTSSPYAPYAAPQSDAAPYVAPQSGAAPYAAPQSYAAPQGYAAPQSYTAPQSYAAPQSGAPYSAAPYSGTPFPGTPYQPPLGPGGGPYPYQPAAQPGSGRAGRVVLVLLAALALSLVSGAIGGLIVHTASGEPTTVINRQNAPQVDRSSVAGVAEAVLPSVVDITTGEGEGSGVIYNADGTIVTNNHVVEGATGQVTVTFSNGKTAKATVVGTDPLGDIAVIKAQGVSGLTAAKFGDSDAARVGDTVLAIGSPLGLQGSVSEGIISALHRTISEGSDQQGGSARSISDALQTDAAINPGNSGGALVNLAGEVVGINTAIATSGGQSSGNIGVGFAISSNRVKSAADQLLKGGKVSHPYLGVKLSDADTPGAFIADVVADGPAAKGGLQKGDLVVKIDSQAINDSTALINVVQAHKVGDKLTMTVQRNGGQQQVTVTLGDTPQ